ncbi:MAG TPA: rhodanese-like domain-containing protein [Acidimicrobiia bacterium]|nr:rhodanese-like domain-containing protein [Acidimicrobiia bacterium]
MAKSWSQMVAEAKAQIENLSVEQMADEMGSGDVVVVDLREAEELAQTGKIPGALHIPRGTLELKADPTSPGHRPELDPTKRVILHCAGGGRSALAVLTMKELGYHNVAHLEGGFGAWQQSGHPIEGP